MVLFNCSCVQLDAGSCRLAAVRGWLGDQPGMALSWVAWLNKLTVCKQVSCQTGGDTLPPCTRSAHQRQGASTQVLTRCRPDTGSR